MVTIDVVAAQPLKSLDLEFHVLIVG